MEVDMEVEDSYGSVPYHRYTRLFGQKNRDIANGTQSQKMQPSRLNFRAEGDTKDAFLKSHKKEPEEEEYWDSQSTTYSKATNQGEQKDRTIEKISSFNSRAIHAASAAEEKEMGSNDAYDNSDCGDRHQDKRRSMTEDKIAELARMSIYYSPPWAACEKIPTLVEAYVALLMKTLLKILIISAIASLAWTLFWDVDRKLKSEEGYYRQLSMNWENKYVLNHCDSHYIPPEAESTWNELYKCMKFNSEENTLYSKAAAGLVAEILNDFFETISYNTIAKFVLILALLMVLEIPYAQWNRLKMRKAKWEY